MTKVCVYAALFGLWPIWAAASTLVPSYGTYFGGAGDTNAAVAVAVDSVGNVIMAGYTTSQSLPGTAHGFQSTKATGFPDNRDVFIAKFDSTGHNLLWATFLGGDGDDVPTAVAVDPSGNIYVMGTTDSTNFPLTARAYLTVQQGSFLSKVSADGSALLYSTLVPVSSALAVNPSGEAYIAGAAYSLSTFVTPSALNITGTIFLARMNSTGTGLIFGALLGGKGTSGSVVTSLTLDASGNCYFAGVTGESNVPTTSQALEGQDPNAGLPGEGTGVLSVANSRFLLEVNPTGSQILYGTYFGLRYYKTSITQISLDSDGAIYFSGSTNGPTFQVTPGAFQITPGSGFIAKLTPGSPALNAFSYLPSLPSVLFGFGNQPQAVYLTFAGPTGSQWFELAELDPQTLGLRSSFTSPNPGFVPISAARVPPDLVWFVGTAGSGSLGSLISADAYQTIPQSSGGAAVLLELTPDTISVSANSLSFQWQIGSGAPPPQEVPVSGLAATAFAASASGGGWLSVGQTGNATPANVNVSVNPAGLNLGIYNGTITITAPDASNSPQTLSVTLQVVAAGQAIIFAPLSDRTLDDEPFSINATASSGLPLTFTSNSNAVCMVSGTTVTLIRTGTCSITATQIGNALYAPATPVTQTFMVTCRDARNTEGPFCHSKHRGQHPPRVPRRE